MFNSPDYYGQSNWQPVKTITLTNCTGNSQTITWDGGGSSSLSYKNPFGINENELHEEDLYNNHVRKIPNIICAYSKAKSRR